MKYIPFPFQQTTVERIEAFDGRALCSLDMGTGKTAIALWYAVRNPVCFPVVVVCPASIKWHWANEAVRFFKLRADVLSGSQPKRGDLRHKSKLYVINYDILGPRRKKNGGNYKGWVQALLELNPGLLILDESHMIADPRTSRSKSIKMLSSGINKVVALSGTPLVNRPKDLWMTLHIVRPDLYPTFFPFARLHCSPKRTFWGGWDFSGASALDVLNRKLNKQLLIRYKRSDVLKDLPAKQRQVIPLDMSKPEEYVEARDEFVFWLTKKYGTDKARKAAKAERLSMLSHLKQLAARLKLPAAFAWIDDFLESTDEKIIIFGIHKLLLEDVRKRYADISVKVTGETPVKSRQLMFRKFLTDKNCRMFVGNVEAAGVGWSAKGVSTVCFLEFPWNSSKVTQCEDRCVGLNRGVEGQSTLVYSLIARNSIETYLVEILQRKAKILSQVLDGGEQPDDLNVFDLLTEKLKKDRR